MTAKIILAIIVASVFAVGVNNIYGDVFTYEPSFEIGTATCTESFDNNLGLAVCILRQNNTSAYTSNQTNADTGDAPIWWSDEQKKYITDEEHTQEAIDECIANPECYYEDAPSEPIFPLPDENSPNATDQTLIEKINKHIGSQCWQGTLGTPTYGIQEQRSFDIPTIERTINGIKVQVLDTSGVTNEDIRGFLGIIEKRVNECLAEKELNDVTSNTGMLSVVDVQFGFCDSLTEYNKAIVPQCGFTGKSHSEIAKDVPIWSQQRVNEEANRDIDHHQWNILEDVCQGFYEYSYKMTFDECRVYFSEIAPEGSPSKKITPTDFGADVEVRVNQFNDDGGKSMYLELTKAKLQKDMAAINKQLRNLESLK